MKKSDIVIVGAGIAGLTAAIYLKRLNADFVILENKLPGGKLNELKTIENYPGFDKTTGSQILIQLMEQVRKLGIKITYGSVQTILKEDDGFEVISDVDHYDAKAVIIATGQYGKSALIKGEKEFSGQGVSYCAVCDGNFFKGLDVAVYGNNNIAIEEALYLSNIVNKLYFVCNSDALDGDEKIIKSLKASKNVEIIFNEEIKEIDGDLMGVTKIVLKNKTLEVSGVFPYVGNKSGSQILNNIKPSTNGIYVKTDESMMSNISGLYVIGDLRDKKLRQLITAASDGAIAATSAFNFVKQK